jgi:hypothetical protein
MNSSLRAWSVAGLVMALGLVSCAGQTMAEPSEGVEAYVVGDRMEPFSLEDQHGAEHRVDGSVRIVLFSRDMEGGDLIRQALAETQPELLDRQRAVYVADISGMPRLIAKMFALPKMRKRPYPMLLDRDGIATARLPDVDERATLLFCKDLRIIRVLHLADAAGVQKQLGIAPTAPDGGAP